MADGAKRPWVSGFCDSSREPGGPNRLLDPILIGGALIATGIHAWVYFAGFYLPFYDWPNHIGLISIFAHGDELGGLKYFERSFIPTPYALFYYLSGLLAQVVPVVVAAKLTLVLTSPILIFSVAYLLWVHGREPRLALISPMAIFGHALGYGFASFVFALPFLFLTLAEFERILLNLSAGYNLSHPRVRWSVLRLACILILCFLGHALVFIAAAWVVGVRFIAYLIINARFELVLMGRAFGALLVSYMGAAFLVLLRIVILYSEPLRKTETTPLDAARPWLIFPPMEQRWSRLAGHLIDRGSAEHMFSMYAVVAAWGLLIVLAIFFRSKAERLFGGYLSVTAGILALYVLGPDSIEKPFSVWLFYSRFATSAAIALWCLPPVRLRGVVGLGVSVLMILTLAYDASLQRKHVIQMSSVAAQYDPVRKLVPKGKRILGLTYGVPPGDVSTFHPTMRCLYFYHLADGAAYAAYLFDNPLIPIRYRRGIQKPKAPFWRTPQVFHPSIHGREFDILILRGQPVELTKKSPYHRLRGEANGWWVFETISPPSWPQDKQ